MILYADSLGVGEAITTGLFIDKLSGIGGIPRGVITEIFGDEGLGKSSLCLQVIAAAQRQGLRCLWVDIEWSFDTRYAESLGVDIHKLGIIREQIGEVALARVEDEIGNWDLIVIDSAGGILPRAEAEKEIEGKTIGGQASIIARFIRKIVPLISIHKVALIVINHAFIDIMSGKLLTSGGRKLQYHKSLSIRLKLKPNTSLKQGERKVGKVVIGEVKKNKLAATEGMEVDSQLIFGKGFSVSADILNDAIDANIITKKGNTYFYGKTKLGVGLSKVRKQLEENKELTEQIKHAL